MLASASVLNLVMLLALTGTPASVTAQTSNGTHSPHGNLNLPCQNCHTASAWKPIRAVPEFDHNQTKYPLRGMHTSVACTQCHVKMVFTNVGQRCQDCHADIHRRQLGANCEQCHTVRGWQVTVQQIQDHNNRFPLTGAHAAVECDACHKNGANSNFQTMSTDCYSCHQSDYTNASNPKHTPQAFPIENCQTCHTTDNWLNAKFDHNATGFPLTGLHTVPPRACADCHVNNNYTLSSTDCYTCHQTDYNNTTNPKHAGSQMFPETECSTCHNTSSWNTANFDHNATGFPLTGSHLVPPRTCADCHKNNDYTGDLATACYGCHQTDFNNAVSPVPHSGFPTTCQNCHDTMQWTDGKFDHATVGFTLTGQHTVPPRVCTDCHNPQFGNYNITTTACVSCHQTDYNNTNNPNHAAAKIAVTCDQCHSTNSWANATFDHNLTAFPLTGSHMVPPRACTDCHNAQFGGYNITNTTCIYCHQNDFNGATSPVAHSGFPTTCENCHDTTAWTDAKFDHTTEGFALTGLHTVPPRACTDCHNAQFGGYNIQTTACSLCHMTDYNNTTNPNHQSANFPTDCTQCHNSTSTWLGATFNHPAAFPLTNLHAVPPRQCSDCHNAQFGGYNIQTTACSLCHMTDYNNTTNPNHVQANYPTDCTQCHNSTSTWLGATFTHPAAFPLTNSHADPPRACTDCHNAQFGNYNITTTACILCHQTDFNNATTPVAHAGFPTTCDSCHDTIAWTDAVFNHTNEGFQLTGMHTVPPRACTDCHNAQFGNYAINTTLCIHCHQTDFNNATSPVAHTGFPTTCELCHDTTAWTDSTFNHNNTAFPLTGTHTTTACALCHVNGNYTTLPTTCIGCHQTDYNNTTNPGHAAQPQFFPTASCSTCHNTTAWTSATFNHTQYTNFSINHGNANGVCSTCHTNSNNYSVFQCTGCHGGNNAANFHHPNVNNYVYNSVNCYQCHSSGGGG